MTLRPDTRIGHTGRHPDYSTVPKDARGAAADVKALREIMDAGPPEHRPGEQAFVTLEDAAETLGLPAAKRQLAHRLMARVIDDPGNAVTVAKAAIGEGIPQGATEELIRRAMDLHYRFRSELSKASRAEDGTVRTRADGYDYRKQGKDWIRMPKNAPPGTQDEKTPPKPGKGPPPPGGAAPKTGDPAPKPGSPAAGPPGKPGATPPAKPGASPGLPGQPGAAAPAPGADPRGDVGERFAAIQTNAKQHGVDVKGAVAEGHTHEHLDEVEDRIASHAPAYQKHPAHADSGGAGGAGPGAGAPGAPGGAPPGGGAPPPGGAPGADAEDPDDATWDAPGGQPGAVPPGAPGATPPGGPPGVGGHVPAPQDAHAIAMQVADLRNQLDEIKHKAHTPHALAQYEELCHDADALSRMPSPDGIAWLTNRVQGFIAMVTGQPAQGATGAPAPGGAPGTPPGGPPAPQGRGATSGGALMGGLKGAAKGVLEGASRGLTQGIGGLAGTIGGGIQGAASGAQNADAQANKPGEDPNKPNQNGAPPVQKPGQGAAPHGPPKPGEPAKPAKPGQPAMPDKPAKPAVGGASPADVPDDEPGDKPSPFVRKGAPLLDLDTGRLLIATEDGDLSPFLMKADAPHVIDHPKFGKITVETGGRGRFGATWHNITHNGKRYGYSPDKGRWANGDEPHSGIVEAAHAAGFSSHFGGTAAPAGGSSGGASGGSPGGGGWQPIPGGKHGGFRKLVGAGKYSYWYPDGNSRSNAQEHHEGLARNAGHDANYHGEEARNARTKTTQDHHRAKNEAKRAESQEHQEIAFGSGTATVGGSAPHDGTEAANRAINPAGTDRWSDAATGRGATPPFTDAVPNMNAKHAYNLGHDAMTSGRTLRSPPGFDGWSREHQAAFYRGTDDARNGRPPNPPADAATPAEDESPKGPEVHPKAVTSVLSRAGLPIVGGPKSKRGMSISPERDGSGNIRVSFHHGRNSWEYGGGFTPEAEDRMRSQDAADLSEHTGKAKNALEASGYKVEQVGSSLVVKQTEKKTDSGPLKAEFKHYGDFKTHTTAWSRDQHRDAAGKAAAAGHVSLARAHEMAAAGAEVNVTGGGVHTEVTDHIRRMKAGSTGNGSSSGAGPWTLHVEHLPAGITMSEAATVGEAMKKETGGDHTGSATKFDGKAISALKAGLRAGLLERAADGKAVKLSALGKKVFGHESGSDGAANSPKPDVSGGRDHPEMPPRGAGGSGPAVPEMGAGDRGNREQPKPGIPVDLPPPPPRPAPLPPPPPRRADPAPGAPWGGGDGPATPTGKPEWQGNRFLTDHGTYDVKQGGTGKHFAVYEPKGASLGQNEGIGSGFNTVAEAKAAIRAHHKGKTKPAAPAATPAAPPPPAPKPSSFDADQGPPGPQDRGVNSHGHKDALQPGQRLALRGRHGHLGDGHVTVLPGGKFEFNGQHYDSSHAMLADIHGTKDHHTTVRRYFKLGGEIARDKAEKAMADVRDLLKSSYVLVTPAANGGIKLQGDLRKAGIPTHLLSGPGATTALLDGNEAVELAEYLGGRNVG